MAGNYGDHLIGAGNYGDHLIGQVTLEITL